MFPTIQQLLYLRSLCRVYTKLQLHFKCFTAHFLDMNINTFQPFHPFPVFISVNSVNRIYFERLHQHKLKINLFESNVHKLSKKKVYKMCNKTKMHRRISSFKKKNK